MCAVPHMFSTPPFLPYIYLPNFYLRTCVVPHMFLGPLYLHLKGLPKDVCNTAHIPYPALPQLQRTIDEHVQCCTCIWDLLTSTSKDYPRMYATPHTSPTHPYLKPKRLSKNMCGAAQIFGTSQPPPQRIIQEYV